MKKILPLLLIPVFFGATTLDFRANEKNDAVNYYQRYLESEISDFGWTGNLNRCKAGEISENVMTNVLNRINLFREMAGVNNDIIFNDEYNAYVQEAAIIMHANDRLSHKPNSGWKCYSESGELGASGSNLSQTANEDLRHVITDLIEDAGQYNEDVGHRRWLLNANATTMGFGATDLYYGVYVTSTENLTMSENTPETVSWPPKGYIPYQLLFKRWSFSIPNADVDFTSAKVSVKANGKEIRTAIISDDASFGDPTIVWGLSEMEDEFSYDYYNMDVKKINLEEIGIFDTAVSVKISNVMVDGEKREFEYEVWIIDPAQE